MVFIEANEAVYFKEAHFEAAYFKETYINDVLG